MPDRYETVWLRLNQLRTALLYNGPLSVYGAYTVLGQRRLPGGIKTASRAPLATLDRHMKILQELEEVTVYKTEPYKTGQAKKFYGLTLYGFLRSFRIPGAIALKNFRRVIQIWLQEEKFQKSFFLPSAEVVEALSDRDATAHLGRFCQFIANMFGDAEDFMDCLEAIGYARSDPTRVIDLAMRFAIIEYGSRFVLTLKALCDHFPSFRTQVQGFIKRERESLDVMQNELLGTGAGLP